MSKKSADLTVADLGEVANCLRLIGHPNRLAIVFYLLKGPCLVSELESELNLHQPNLSQHLSILRDANILTSQRQAKAVLYELKEGESREIIAAVYGRLRPGGAVAAASVRSQPVASRQLETVSTPVESETWRHRSGETDDASVFAQVLPPSRA